MTYAKAAHNSLFLFGSTIASMALAYVFWLSISYLTGPESIGRLAAATGFGWIVATIAMLGIPIGIQRFLGKAMADNDDKFFARAAKTSTALVVSSISIVSICLVIFKDVLMTFLNLPEEFFLISVVMVVGVGMYQLLRGIMISTMRTKLLLLADTVGETGRIVVTVLLIIYFYDAIGLLGGFVALYATTTSILGVHVIRSFLNARKKIRSKQSGSLAAEIIRASTANWIPAIISQVGTQMGFLITFGILGAFDTGLYFIAFALYSILFAIPSSILSVAYPLMSGMKTGQEEFLHVCIKIGLIVSVPISIVLMVYASPFLNLIGSDFQAASFMVILLVPSLIPATIGSATTFLAYSRGKYFAILTMGLTGSVTKLVLYPLLISDFGAVGASTAFLIGTVVAFAISVLFAYKLGFRPRWLEIGMTLMIPGIIGGVVLITNFHVIVGTTAILLGSWILYLRLGIFKVPEMRSLVSNALPSNMAVGMCNGIERLYKLLK